MCKCCKDGPSFGCHLSLVTSGIHVPLILYVLILLQEWEYLVLCVWSQIFDNLGCGDF